MVVKGEERERKIYDGKSTLVIRESWYGPAFRYCWVTYMAKLYLPAMIIGINTEHKAGGAPCTAL